VSLTERETANGASPISDGETLYAARTVVIPFAIQSNYNHTDLIRARILLGRLIGWHDVRMDINDDGDETVLYGYIEAKYSDIPYDHTDAGVITLVCPDPRRVSKHASTISMNTSSSSLGGLSFGAAYELAWTGTPNASTSTLSQDGTVVATNLVTDPAWYAHTPRNWQAKITKNGAFLDVVKNGDSATVYPFGEKEALSDLTANTDYVAVAQVSGQVSVARTFDQTKGISNYSAAIVGDHVVWQVHVDTLDSRNLFFHVDLIDAHIKMGMVGVFTLAGWNIMQALGVDWFDGDSQSPQPNAGLVFPLNFRQSGNTGNTGMIDNNGSYTSMPTITAHGWLDNSLTIHWNTSDGHEGDLSFNGNVGNVPVTINTDTHSAIMGGLDVSYQLGSRDWPRIPAGGSCSFALLASGGGWVSVQSNDTYM
jgi:hypothetical protein